MTETTIGFLPDSDGILKTFIDRYTTMLIHDSIYMEEHPPESVLSDTLGGLLDPQIHRTSLLGSGKPWDLTMQGASSKDSSNPSLEQLLSQFHVEHHNPSITMEIMGPIQKTSEKLTIEAEPKDDKKASPKKQKKAKAKQSDAESKADSDSDENETKKIVYPLHGPVEHEIVIRGTPH